MSLLVIHNISLPPGEFGTGYIQAFFQNCLAHDAHPYFATLVGVCVSSHLLIDRCGQVTQFVSLEDRAWHAGASSYNGVADCNNYSIGVELEGTDDLAYTEQQYQALAKLCRLICSVYPAVSAERIVGHNDIAPGRKTDPGSAFDWCRLRELMEG